MLICTLIILGTVILDQLTKFLVVEFLDKVQPFVIIDGIFRFSYVENRGAAFGMLDDSRWVFMVLSVIGIVAMAVYLYRFAPKNALLQVAISLAIGGGIGNMIDRVRLGYVIDFIDFYAFPKVWKWVFNVADACICIGAGLLILYMILDIVREGKEKKLAKDAGADGGDADEGN